ncbi:unnamed protein product [Hermetia illucens]|uniref:Protein croquemort n=2 Tax=Hermetia illucens TaxID=343691 RepID=A0A7R8UG48_HERIL|nr:unnamed protein product [Hermetia illucens]
MAKEMAIRPGSKSFETWRVPPIPMSLDVYFFNWTNSEDFMNKTIKPVLQELGPYRFTEKPEKVDIVWHPENASISFRKKSIFFFDQEGSSGYLHDNITALNIIALSAAGRAINWDYVRQKSVSIGLNMYEQPMAVTRTVDELLFEGYSDDMIDVAREFPLFGADVPVLFDKFGWFYTRNNSAELTGYFNMYTGVDDINKLGQMYSWNFNSTTNFFGGSCGKVQGSAGEFYPPRPQPSGSIMLFTAELCRYITLDYTETVTIHGLEGYKFSGTTKTVDNGTKYPENQCFCSGKCVPSGVIDVSACRFGTPVYMSFPHYYNADPYYVNQVEGLTPNKDKHEFYMVLEPLTGVVLEASGRFQINMLVQPVKNIKLYEDAPYVFMPLLWFEQKVTIPEAMANELRMVVAIPTTGQICASVIFIIGLVMLVILPIRRMYRQKYKVDTTEKVKAKLDNGVAVEKGPEISPLLEKKNGFLGTVTFKSNGANSDTNEKKN